MHRDQSHPRGHSHSIYRELLLERRNDLLAGMGVRFDTAAQMGRVAEEDQAQITHEEFISLIINGWGHTSLRLVDQALDRLQTGDYGICLGCGSPIPEKRLMAIPWASHCVPCQEDAASSDQQGEVPGGRAPETYV